MQSSHVGGREITTTSRKSHEMWSEILVHVDNHIMTTPPSRKLLVRCETNIYKLYKGADESELQIIDSRYWVHGKVSPTTDQRSGGNRGDPDNSALTGSAILFNGNFKCLTLRIALLWLVVFIFLS